MAHDSPMLIMSHVDDAGMSPHEFRVMAHICRRAGYKQDHNCHCWSSAPTISVVTGINVKTVRKAIKNLTAHGWLIQHTRTGQSTLLTPATGTPISHLKRGPKSPPTLPKQLPYPINNPTQTTPMDPTQITGGDPTQTTTPKGIPEGKPLREPSAEQPALIATDDLLPFASERFKIAWDAWKQHRKEIRHKLTPSNAAACLKKLRGWGEERSIAAIWHSIENGWQGIFESKETTFLDIAGTIDAIVLAQQIFLMEILH
jgi:hypothetical protein